ncbi:hypothetical protein F66182_6030 [Fusarium sp. NRRL 66182]|nr:hypothetical protein F66182_6030 [Fusarium sp. NRRL 66182]
MDRNISLNQASFDFNNVATAVETLFNRILNQLAETDVFSKSDAPSIFVVYAHDNEQLGTAHASCVIHIIQWLQEIRSRTVSDRAPLPLLFYRRDGSDSVRNIFSSQLCLLPEDNASDDGTINRVEKVVVCGSELLRKYYNDPFTSPYLDAIKTAYLKAHTQRGTPELPEEAMRRVVEAQCQRKGFHHVLTELGLLMLRNSHKEYRSSVIPLTLDGSLMEWLPFWENCDVVLKLKSPATPHLHQLFFKLLGQIYPQEHRLINQYKNCYDQTHLELHGQPALSLGRAQQIIDMAIIKTQRTLSDIENASFRGRRRDLENMNQAKSHHETVLGVYDKLELLKNTTEASLDERRFKDMVEWLSTCSYKLHHKSVSAKVMAGSGQWITKHPEYQDWLDSTSPSTILIHGVRGCGKSSMLSVIIDQLLHQAQHNKARWHVAYYYCSGTESESDRANPDAILRSILRQVTVDERARVIDPIVISEYEKLAKHYDLCRLDIHDCSTLLQQSTANKTTIIALDAIDELDVLDRAKLIQALELVMQESGGVVKVLVTSRNDMQIKKLLHSATTIEVSREQNRTDIVNFVDKKVTSLVHSRAFLDQDAPHDLLHRIRDALIAGAQEMFLWVELQVQMLIRKNSVMDILKALEDGLTDNLDKIYEETYKSFLVLDDTAKAVVEGVFCWILYAKRPLTTDALSCALRLHPKLASHPQTVPLPNLLDVCLNLVVVDSATNTLRLCHPSARDYMKHRSMFSEINGHRLMASASLRKCYLGPLPDVGRVTSLEVVDEFSLYSALYWPEHLKASETSSDIPLWVVENLNEFVLGENESNVDEVFVWWLNWVDKLLETLPPYHGLRLTHECLSSDEQESALFTASVFGLKSLAELVFDKGHDISLEQRSKTGHTPLYLACSFGHGAVASILIQHGANKDVVCGTYGNPLQAACFKGHVDVVQLLLDCGVSPKNSTQTFKNALHAACEGDQAAIADLLVKTTSIIETEADYDEALQMTAEAGFRNIYEHLIKPEIARKFGQSTVSKARLDLRIVGIIKKGRVDILQCLLESDPEMSKTIPPDAVATVALRGHMEMVEKLYILGMSIEVEGKFGSPLRSASLQGEFRVVRKLLDLGSDPTAKGSRGDSLQAAASKGHLSIVQLLIDRGAHVNQQGPPRGSPIQAAAYHGHDAVVKLLIQQDAEIYCETYKFKDALYAAVQGGHDQIAAFLQENYPPPPGRILPGVARGDDHKQPTYFDRHNSNLAMERGVGADSPHPESTDTDDEGEDVAPQDQSKDQDGQTIEKTHPLVIASGIESISIIRQELQAARINEDVVTEALVIAASKGKHQAIELLLEEGLPHISYIREPKEKALIASVEGKQLKSLQVLADSLNNTITVISWGFALQKAAYAGQSITKRLLELDLIPWHLSDMTGLAMNLGYELRHEIYADPVSACRDALENSHSAGHHQVASQIWTWVLSKGPENLKTSCKEWDALALVAAKHADVPVLDRCIALRDECLDIVDQPQLSVDDFLVNAVRGDNLNSLKYLLKKVLREPDACDIVAPAFLEACRTGYTDTTQELLSHDSISAIDVDMVVQGAIAASAADHEVLVLRILDFLGPEEKERAITAALLSAAGTGKTNLVTGILEGTKVQDNAEFPTIMTRVLVTACESGHADIVQICLDQGADVEKTVERAPASIVTRQGNGMPLFSRPRFVTSQSWRPPHVAHRFPRPSGPAFAMHYAEGENDNECYSEESMESEDSDKTIDQDETDTTDALQASVCAFTRILSVERMPGGEWQSKLTRPKATKQLKIVSLILDNVSDLSDRESRLSTHPLRIAVASGTDDLVQMLLDYGAADQFSPRQLKSLILIAARRETSVGSKIVLKLLDYDRRASLPADEDGQLDYAILQAIKIAVDSLGDAKRFRDILSLKGMISSEKAAQDLMKGGLQKLIKTIFRKLPHQSAEPDAFGDALHAAAAAGDLATVKLLIKQHVNVNHTRYNFHTALGAAAEFGQVQIIKELVRANVDIHPKDRVHGSFGKQEPAIKAIIGGQVRALKALVDNGLKPKVYAGDVPLLVHAAQSKSAAMVGLLLQAGADPNEDPTALVTAAQDGNLEMMSALLDAGADPNALAIYGYPIMNQLLCSPLYAACKAGHLEAVNLLLERGADAEVDSGDFDGLPLVVAARQGHFGIVQVLLSKNCDPFRRSKGMEALSSKNRQQLLSARDESDIVPRGNFATRQDEPLGNAETRDPSAKGNEYLNAIESACDAQHGVRKRSLQMVKSLSGALQDSRHGFLEALRHTSKTQNCGIFEELLEHVTLDSSLLDLASRCGSVKAVRLIIGQGVSPMDAGQDGNTPLQMAIDYENWELVEFLVADRVLVESQQGKPLSLNLYSLVASALETCTNSTLSKHKSIVACEKAVEKLLGMAKEFQPVTTADQQHIDQALYFASHIGSGVLAKILLEFGSRPSTQTYLVEGSLGHGLSLLRAAIGNNHPSVLKALLMWLSDHSHDVHDFELDVAFQACLAKKSPMLLETFLEHASIFKMTEHHLLLAIEEETWRRGPGETNLETILRRCHDLKPSEAVLIGLVSHDMPFALPPYELWELWQFVVARSDCGLTTTILRAASNSEAWQFLSEYSQDNMTGCSEDETGPVGEQVQHELHTTQPHRSSLPYQVRHELQESPGRLERREDGPSESWVIEAESGWNGHTTVDREQGDLLQFHLSRLAKEISKYDNSKVRDEIAEPWNGCACSVYKPDAQPGGDLLPVISRTPSITGTVKATSIWKMDEIKTLFVSIRGTACKADHLVNFNRDRKDAAPVFRFPEGPAEVFAHSGFLACANTLLPWLTHEIIRQVELDDSISQIVFTGHSAGGAVASISFLHFICHCPGQLSQVKFSLITFGAPPITSHNVTSLAQGMPQTQHMFAVVNEYDIVPRIDQSYITSIISLYRSAYGLPLTEFNNTSFVNSAKLETSDQEDWQLPQPDFHVVGDIVVLRSKMDINALQQGRNQNSTAESMWPQRLDMLRVSRVEFCKLIFSEISVHKRRVYLDRLERLARIE